MNAGLWTCAEIAQAIGGALHNCAADLTITGVQFDSRLVEAGDIFIALKGDADGHAFVDKAIAAGAACAIVEHMPQAQAHIPHILVRDTMRALEALGVAARVRSAAQRVAITGSVGKTSTKEMLAHVLAEFGKTHAAKASFNNHIGVPLTLARMPAEAQFGVFEIGMNHAGEIVPLTGLVQPHIAIVTAVEPVHIEHFASIEGIADAKSEIFTGLVHGGIAIVNVDSQCAARVISAAQAHAARVLTYSAHTHTGADAVINHIELLPDCAVVSAQILGEEVVYKIGAPGAHFALNSLAVLLACCTLKQDIAIAALALSAFTPPKGRGARLRLKIEQGNILILDESYNANPASTRAALDVLRTTPVNSGNTHAHYAHSGGRRIAVLGQMLELGAFSHHAHTGLLQPIEDVGVDLVFCAGEAMKPLWDLLPARVKGVYAQTAAGLEMPLFETVRDGDVVLFKGSNGSGVWRIVDSFKTRFTR